MTGVEVIEMPGSEIQQISEEVFATDQLYYHVALKLYMQTIDARRK